MTNYYRIINVSPNAQDEEIKKAIHRELRVWRNRANASQIQKKQEAESRVKVMEEVKAVLLDSNKRAEHDSKFKRTLAKERKIDRIDIQGKENLIEEGWRLLIADNVPDALYVATKATERDAENSDAWALLGQTKLRWGETEDAVSEYKRAIKLCPNEASYYYDLGTVYELTERWNDALEQYRRASQINPKSTMYRAATGVLLIRNEMYEEGVEILKRCVLDEPDNETYQWFLAIAYIESTCQNWIYVSSSLYIKPGFYATEKTQVEEAEQYIEKAEKLNINDRELRGYINAVKESIKKMYERRFYGYRYITSIFLIVGMFLFFMGVSSGQEGDATIGFLSLLLPLIALFYIYSSKQPQYLLNKKIMEGDVRPTLGMEILWIIIYPLYPFLAIRNYYKNYIKL